MKWIGRFLKASKLFWERLFVSSGAEPSQSESKIVPKITSFLSAILLAFDLSRRYLDILPLGAVVVHSQHLLMLVSAVSLLYIATKARSRPPTISGPGQKTNYEFAYSKVWRRGCKVALVALLSIYVASFWLSPQPMKLIEETWQPGLDGAEAETGNSQDKAQGKGNLDADERGSDSALISVDNQRFLTEPIVLDMTVKNNSGTKQYLTRLGIISRHVSGDFSCRTGAYAIGSIASYVIRYPVNHPETWIAMKPILAVPPNEEARFTISLIPDPGGACGVWSSEIAVVVKGYEGESLRSSFHRIGSEDMVRIEGRAYSRKKLLDIVLRSPDAGSRDKAISLIVDNDYDDPEMIDYLNNASQGPSKTARKRALEALKKLQ